MSVQRNILANYASQGYVALLAIAMLPYFIRSMGAEAYGLVSLFAMMQAWFALLDLGLTPTMTRETARFRGGEAGAWRLRRLLRSLEAVFLAFAVLGGGCLIFAADQIAANWLKVGVIETREVVGALRLMTLTVMLRWMSELYRGVLVGCERMVWLGAFSSVMATARFLLVIPLFHAVGTGVREFFMFQLCVAGAELLLLMRKAYGVLPAVPVAATRGGGNPLREVMGFSLSMALASAAWVSASQADKLLLSGLLSLADYGWFSLTALAASAVLLLSSPIVSALMPRMSLLHAKGNEAALLSLYRLATQWVGLVAWPVCAVLVVQPQLVLWVWTGDTQLAAHAAPTLSLYALGNGAMAMAAFPYYLQFAKGELRLHLLGTALFVILLLPSMAWAVGRHGALGAGWAWFATNLTYFTLFVPVAHARYAAGLHGRWLLRDVAPQVALSFAGAAVSLCLPRPDQRLFGAIQLLLTLGAALITGSLGSSWVRGSIATLLLIWRLRLKRQTRAA
ncbi:MAG: oligosaccharide flippase family protein [Betaproteobacteria bacterium]